MIETQYGASYRVHIRKEYHELLMRIAQDRADSAENLIEIAAEEAVLEYAKSRGWPLPSST